MRSSAYRGPSSATIAFERGDQVRETREVPVRTNLRERVGRYAHCLAQPGQRIELPGDEPVPREQKMSLRPRRVRQHRAPGELDRAVGIASPPLPSRELLEA